MQMAGEAEHAYTLVPRKSEWADYAVQASVGPIRETSSNAIRQRKIVNSRLSSLSHCGLILDIGTRELIST